MPNFGTQTKTKKRVSPQGGKKKPPSGGSRGSRPVSAPAAVGAVSRARQPRMNSSRGSFTVSNEELVTTSHLVTSAVFAEGLTTYIVNPGIEDIFPWLHMIGLNFQSYRFRKLTFHYRPSCATSTSGIAVLGFDPDPSNHQPQTLSALSSLRHRVTGSPWAALSLQVPESALQALSGRKMIRAASSSIPVSSRPAFDCGQLHMYLGAGSANLLGGLLYVSYSVELFDPQPPEYIISATLVTSGSGPTAVHPFGTAPSVLGSPYISYEAAETYAQFRCSHPGRYLVSYLVNQATAVSLQYGFAAAGGTVISWSGTTAMTAEQIRGVASVTFRSEGDALDFEIVDSNSHTITGAVMYFCPIGETM